MEDISLGNSLKDGYSRTSKWIKANLEQLSDIESFYRQRAAIEKEYAEKLSKLTTEAFNKRSKAVQVVSVGEEPTITPGSLECASMVAWKEVLLQTEQIVKEKVRFAQSLELQIGGEISKSQAKYTRLREMWKNFNDETTSIRDKNYQDMSSKKKAYDQACEQMESQRSKTMKSNSQSAKEKMEKREHEMNIAKNNYILSIAVCNRLKDKYCYQDTPELLDGLQGLNEAKVSKINSILLNANELERTSLDRIKSFNDSIDTVVKQNLPRLDSTMFLKHNMSNWVEPADFQFIPCQFWHDDDAIVTEDVELESLKVKFNDAYANYERYEEICHDEKKTVEDLLVKRNELIGESFSTVVTKSRDEYNAFEDLLSKSIIGLQRFSNDDNKRVMAEATIDTIRSVVGDTDMTIYTPIHKEKKSKFSLFSKRDKKAGGVDNEDEDQVHEISQNVNNIQISSGNHKTRIFTSLGKIATTIVDSFEVPAPYSEGSAIDSSLSFSGSALAIALYAYQPAGDDELPMGAGEKFSIVESDDGSGWTILKNSHGQEGLVPTSYIKITQAAAPPKQSAHVAKKQGPKVAPRKGAKRVTMMEILYDYTAQGDDELNVSKGDEVAVLAEDDGSGWTECEFNGQIGLLPSSYGRIIT